MSFNPKTIITNQKRCYLFEFLIWLNGNNLIWCINYEIYK